MRPSGSSPDAGVEGEGDHGRNQPAAAASPRLRPSARQGRHRDWRGPGIGRAAAVAFAREGADVMGIDITGSVSATLEVAPATPEELAGTGRSSKPPGRAGLRRVSISVIFPRSAPPPQGASGLWSARHPVRECRHPDVQTDPRMEDADWQDTIDVNLTGTCNAIRAVAPHLVENGGGRIIVTSSTQGRHGTKFGAAYSASKWGIIGLMKSAALELGVIQDHRQRRHPRAYRHASHPTSAAVCAGR